MSRRLEVSDDELSPPDTKIEFDGEVYPARAGESLAVALWANGQRILSRSSKYHRARGAYCGLGECSNCLCRVDGAPSQRLCQQYVAEAGPRTALAGGEQPTNQPSVQIESQNTDFGRDFDMLRAIDWVFADGLDHHHLLTGISSLNRMAVKTARRLSGLGELPQVVNEAGQVLELRAELVIIGGGTAGLAAADIAATHGMDVLVLEGDTARCQMAAVHSGGRFRVRHSRVVGRYDSQLLIGERQDGMAVIRYEALLLTLGSMELPPACAGNDLPGVVSMFFAETLLGASVVPGEKTAVVIATEAGLGTVARAGRIAGRLEEIGQVSSAPSALESSFQIHGSKRVTAVQRGLGESKTKCDAVVFCDDPVPAYRLAQQVGVGVDFSPRRRAFVPRCDIGAVSRGATDVAGVFMAGSAAAFGDGSVSAETGVDVAKTIITRHHFHGHS